LYFVRLCVFIRGLLPLRGLFPQLLRPFAVWKFMLNYCNVTTNHFFYSLFIVAILADVALSFQPAVAAKNKIF
jgi:hypothetical protein